MEDTPTNRRTDFSSGATFNLKTEQRMPGAKDEPYFTVNEEVEGSSPPGGGNTAVAQR